MFGAAALLESLGITSYVQFCAMSIHVGVGLLQLFLQEMDLGLEIVQPRDQCGQIRPVVFFVPASLELNAVDMFVENVPRGVSVAVARGRRHLGHPNPETLPSNGDRGPRGRCCAEIVDEPIPALRSGESPTGLDNHLMASFLVAHEELRPLLVIC